MRACIAIILTCLATPVFAQSAQKWKVTLQLVSGNFATCISGSRGTMSIEKNVLSYTPSGWSFSAWSIQLAADGSADLAVPAYKAVTLHVNVPAGSGPRLITSTNLTNACNSRFIPD